MQDTTTSSINIPLLAISNGIQSPTKFTLHYWYHTRSSKNVRLPTLQEHNVRDLSRGSTGRTDSVPEYLLRLGHTRYDAIRPCYEPPSEREGAQQV